MNRNYNGTTVETDGVRTIAGGGTGAADAATARTNLGLGTPTSGNASPTQVVLGKDSRLAGNGMFRREDFLNGSNGLVLFASNVAGGSITTATSPTINENRAGIQRFQTGATGSADQRGGVTTQSLTNFFPGDGNRYYYGVGLRTVAPYFDATTQGFYQFGFVNVASSFGACFLGFTSQNGGNWMCHSSNLGATTSFDTGISVSDANWKDFAFVYYENGDRVDFFVNNTRIVTFWRASGTNNATNIYSAKINTSGNLVGLKGMVHRVSSTAASYGLDVDYIDFGVRYSQTTLDRNQNAIALL